MDTNQLAAHIAEKVVADTSFWVAVVGILGGIVGALLTMLGNLVLHRMQDGPRRRLAATRKAILGKMLADPRFPEGWRRISTLSRVIGAEEEVTKCLLIELGARASESDDGLWGLISRHPLEKIDQ